MTSILEFQDVSKAFDRGKQKYYALKGINLKIEKNTVNHILGPSGSGKSTLLNLASFMDTPTEGAILINGKVASVMSDSQMSQLRREEIGIIYQRDNLLPYLNILENVMLPMFEKNRENAVQILKKVGINDFNKFPEEISEIDEQKAALSRALINNPSLLLADEPTGELNSSDAGDFMEQLKAAVNNSAVLIVSNNPDIGGYVDNVYSLKDGVLTENIYETVIK